MDYPLVTISIPTYNQQNYIAQAVQSCLDQTYQNIEVNILDDGSTDNTYGEISKFLTDRRVNYLRNENNIGRVNNYKKGLESANGEWVINLDGDDFFVNINFLQNAIVQITKNTADTVIFYLSAMYYGDDSDRKLSSPSISQHTVVLKSSDWYKRYYSINHFSHFGIIANKKLMIDSGIAYTKNISSSDKHTFLTLALIHPDLKIILTKEISGYWRWDGNNFSKSLNFKQYYDNYFQIFKVNTHAFKTIGVLQTIKWEACHFFLTWGSYFKKKIMGK